MSVHQPRSSHGCPILECISGIKSAILKDYPESLNGKNSGTKYCSLDEVILAGV
jgi:hypothetical protein